MDRSMPGRAILAIASAYLALMIILPIVYPYGSFVHLDGTPGVIDNLGKLGFADPVTKAVYSIGDLFCHQEQTRSFMINGSQMAFCQRDVSILIGLIGGLVFTDLTSKRINITDKMVPIVAAMLIASTLMEWGIEFLTGHDMLIGRMVTGAFAGAGIALVIQYIVSKQYEEVMGLGKGG